MLFGPYDKRKNLSRRRRRRRIVPIGIICPEGAYPLISGGGEEGGGEEGGGEEGGGEDG